MWSLNPAVLVKTKLLPRLDFLLKAPRRDLLRGGAVVVAIGLMGVMFKTQFGLFIDMAETRCLPERVYVGYPRTDILNRGDIVSFRANNRMMFDLMTGNRIAKIVAGVAGDYVKSNEMGTFVNGHKLGERSPISIKNLAAKGKQPLDVDRVLQPGEIFVLGTLPRSFDSRYWGVMAASSVDRLVIALF